MDNVFSFATARATSRANLTATWLDGGEIHVYDATRAATSNTAITGQTLLLIFSLPSPAGTVANGVFTAGSVAAALILATGNATWARVFDSSAVAVGDCDVGATNSGAMIEINNTALVSGAYCSMVSFTLNEG